ncbi:MAG: sulfate transporter ATP-binding protein [Microbacteriaceae bacterium]|nr:sulfate transporter ATP-binding protein [Microbacteriaceae bacterium]
MTLSEAQATATIIQSTAIRVQNVTKRFGRDGEQTVALRDVSLTVRPGEFLCVVGRSGCGKSTLLNLIADLDRPSEGFIDVGARKVGVMFQEASLFPWLTVRGNIDLALKLSGVPKDLRGDRIQELLETVQLSGMGAKRPHELSGGMRQRVALARTLAQDCEILLMDEPFASLDAITRDAMHEQTERIWAERHLTIVFVTHNVREAARLANRVIVMKPAPGRIGSQFSIDIPRPRRMEDLSVAKSAADLHELLQEQEAGHE